jgi:hypothetical protein
MYSVYEFVEQVLQEIPIDCVPCPEESLSTSDDGSASQGACECKYKLYDRSVYGVIYGHQRNFNDSSTWHIMEASSVAIKSTARCIPCADDETEFMSCPASNVSSSTSNRLAGIPVIKEGYGWYSESTVTKNPPLRNETQMHFFACPFEESCLATKLEVFEPGSSSLRNNFSNCDKGYEGLLCGECSDGWAQTRRGCVFCDPGRDYQQLIFGISAIIALAVLFRKVVRYNATTMELSALWGGVLQRIWPRMNQSFKIMLTNYQVLSRMPAMTGVGMPSPFSDICQAIGDVIDGAVDLIPGVACSIGGSFGRRLYVKVCTPLMISFVIFCVHRFRVWKLVNRQMPIKPGMRKSWRAKVARALVRSQLIHTSCGWVFAMVYLLYPSTSSIIFETFYCRKLSENTRVLMADYSVLCIDKDGNFTQEYTRYFIFSCVTVVLWSFGVPAFYAHQLYKHRRTIKEGNMKFVGIAYLRPLFQFFKPNCYLFEVWLTLEKLALTGIIVLVQIYIGGFFFCNILSMGMTTYMLCLFVKFRPSKTDPYNTANIMGRLITIMTLVCSVALKYPQSESSWINPAALGMFLCLIQIPFWVYLIKV